MKLKEFVKYAQGIRPDWQELDVVIIAPNDMEFEPKIKAVPKDGISLMTSMADRLVITTD